jgi:hypothetical protein
MRLILDAAKSSNIILRLLGSIAIRMHSESARAQVIPRVLTDIDFAGYSKQSQQIIDLFRKLGYSADDAFNTLHGTERLLFYGRDNLRVDVFLDVLSMSHKLDLRGRLELDYPTLSLTDLLMTKLQIVELNEKDVKDIICLLNDHEVADEDGPEKIDGRYIADLCAKDWGIHKTFAMNITRTMSRLDSIAGNEDIRDRVTKQAETLLRKIGETPKTMKWKMRAKIGEKKRWYELPQV